MSIFLNSIVFILVFAKKAHMLNDNILEESASGNIPGTKTQNYVFWPNATVPFYINPDHFDREQSTSIMTTLALFAFKSCLKFLPVLAPPQANQHVLVIANPEGSRQCAPSATGHPLDEPHVLILGYDCLRPPQIDMMLMKALGFPFEHNRASRDLFIEVQFENIDPSAMELFTKDNILPLELRSLAFDVNSVMHFGERDYSKNGHRTIIFKDRAKHPVTQNRVGLSPLDLRKIEIVYGPECRKRDRQEKIELCQNYPAVARKKREVTEITNLRVNRDITPPPKDNNQNLDRNLQDLGIETEIQDIVDQIFKASGKALSNARVKYCNSSQPKTDLKMSDERQPINSSRNGILDITATIVDYVQNMVDKAILNITVFCQSSEDVELTRAGCNFFGNRHCPKNYRSTKSGPVQHYTQHRPFIHQSTKHDGRPFKPQYHPGRSGNNTEETEATTASVRRKRHAEGNEDTNKTNDEKARRDEEKSTTTYKERSDNNAENVKGKDLSLNNDLRMAVKDK